MADDKSAPFQAGKYVKGDEARHVTSVKDAVQAEFEGFKRVQEDGDVASGFAAVNDNDPESFKEDVDHRELNEDYDFEQNAEFSDDQAEPLDESHFDSETVSDTAAVPEDEPSGEPVDRSNPSRSFS